MISNTKDRYSKYLFGIVSLLLLRYLYIFLVVNMLEDAWYSGTGGYGISFNLEKELVSVTVYFGIVLVFARLYSMQKTSFSQNIAVLLMILYFMPLSCSFSLNNLSCIYFFSTTLFTALVLFLLCRTKKTSAADFNVSGVESFKINKTINIVCVILCIILIIYKLSYNGLDFNLSLNSEDVYSNRADYAEYRSAISGSVFAYFLVILLNICEYVAPIYCYLSIKQKNYFGAALALIAIVSSFSLASGKGGLLFLGVLVLVLFADKLHIKLDNPSILITSAVMALFIVAVIDFLFIHSNLLFSSIIRRVMYIPAWMGTFYYDFFTSNLPLLFSDSAIGLQMIMPAQYEGGVLNLISQTYFQGTVPSPNTGLFAEAIMQLGYLGVAIFPFVISAILRSCGSVYEKMGKGIALLVATKAAIQLMNVPILRTDFVLSFVLLAVVFAMIMNKRVSVKQEGIEK